MQKNNFCLLPNKILVYEETDTLSQSIFNSKRHLFTTNNPNNKYINKKNYSNKKYFYKCIILVINNYIISKYEKYYKKNNNIFYFNYICKNYNFNDLNKKESLIEKYYSFNQSKIIFPTRAFYYRHHLEFLEKPNLISNYFNNVEKLYGLKKLIEYQNSKKKDGSTIRTKDEEVEDQKIFDTNVLEQIENYSTTITQASNNEKLNTITPFEIFRRCEENKRLVQKEKINIKNINKNNNNNNKAKINQKEKDVKSVTFSESGISVYSKNSKNIIDDSLIKNFVKELSQEPKKYKQEEKKMISTFLNKKKEVIQKIVKFHKNINSNINPRINCINKFIKKEIKKENKISTSTNKKSKKIILDSINQNPIEKNKTKLQSYIKNIKRPLSNSKKKLNSNSNYPSFNLQHQRKVVFNLKKQSCKKKRHTVQLNDNIKNNIKKKNSNLVSISINNVDDLLKFFLTPQNEKKYTSKEKEQKLKKQNKKNSALTFVNNVFNINTSQQKSSDSEEKYKKIKKAKSPSIRLFLTTKEKNDNKKRKSVLYPEQNGSLLMKSMNFTNRKNNLRNKHKPNNAVTLSQNFDSIMRNYLK